MVMLGRKLRDRVTLMNKIRPEASRIRNSLYIHVGNLKKNAVLQPKLALFLKFKKIYIVENISLLCRMS